MLTVRGLPALGAVATVASLAALEVTVGLGPAGWVTGLMCGVAVNAAVATALASPAWSHVPGPADLVTLTRAVIACALAGLTAEALLHQVTTAWFVPITVVALCLDAIDGPVARRTGSSSAFGSRFDGEVDAFLILVLSVYATPTAGVWPLASGLMRYVFGAAGRVVPWMGGRLPYRYWRKVVTATQGVVLTVAAADVLPRWVSGLGLAVGLVLLSESFGRDVLTLWRARSASTTSATSAHTTVAVTAVAGPEPQTEAA